MNRPSFPRHNRAFRSGLLAGSFPWIVAGVVVLFVFFGMRMLFPQALISVAAPVWQVGQWVVARTSGTPADRATLEAENEVLTAENIRLQAALADVAALLGTRTAPEKGIVAGVRARPPVAPYDVLVINQGSDHGVIVGARAYGAGGTPIGAVTEVVARSARVTLYSTRGSVQQAWAGATRAPVTLSGMGSGAFEALSPRGTAVAVGDTVYLADDGAVPIGTVVALEEDPSSPNVTLYVRPFTNPFSLPWVTVSRD